jgi:hypothetical protein
VPAPQLRILSLQANASAADDVHRLKCELVYMRDREEKLKQEVAESKQELQVGACCQGHGSSSDVAAQPTTTCKTSAIAQQAAPQFQRELCFLIFCR